MFFYQKKTGYVVFVTFPISQCAVSLFSAKNQMLFPPFKDLNESVRSLKMSLFQRSCSSFGNVWLTYHLRKLYEADN